MKERIADIHSDERVLWVALERFLPGDQSFRGSAKGERDVCFGQVRPGQIRSQNDRALRVAWIGAAIAAALCELIGLSAAAFPVAWLSLFDTAPAMLDAGARYLRVVGPAYGLFGLGMALYFASQGAGRLLWPFLANLARLIIAAFGGYLALRWTGDTPVPGGGFGRFTLKGQAKMVGRAISLSGVNVELDHNAAEGVLTYAANGQRTWQGTLAAGDLDLTPYVSTIRLMAELGQSSAAALGAPREVLPPEGALGGPA